MLGFKNMILYIITILDFTSGIPINHRGLQLMGSNKDQQGCYSDGGYQWCDETKNCIRPWETKCEKTEYCPNSPLQLCRMKCPPVNCPTGECALRIGSCCDYKCSNNYNH